MRFSAKVIENRETEDEHVRTLVLQPETPNFTFLPGQWVSIRQPLAEKEVVRAYSMLEPDRLVLCLDAVENGLCPRICAVFRPAPSFRSRDRMATLYCPIRCPNTYCLWRVIPALCRSIACCAICRA